MKVNIQKTSGKVSGKKITLSDKIFSIEPNDHAIYLDVKSHLANKRQGTSKVKGRSEIIGSTRKIKKQKGTGTARAGSIKSPLFRGGGQIFGPEPRNYLNKVNLLDQYQEDLLLNFVGNSDFEYHLTQILFQV